MFSHADAVETTFSGVHKTPVSYHVNGGCNGGGGGMSCSDDT